MTKHVLNSPCAFCGFSGRGYWQRGTHSRDCPMYYTATRPLREKILRHAIRKQHLLLEGLNEHRLPRIINERDNLSD